MNFKIKEEINKPYLCVILIVFLVSTMLLISGCSIVETASSLASQTTDENYRAIDNYINGDGVDIKYDSLSAEDVMDDRNSPDLSDGYYDEKSGQYVSKLQFDINSFIDNLKTFWIPVCVLSGILGFVIRRLNHSSATLRRIGFFLEITFPFLLSVLVYVACALADSSVVDFFDNLF